MIRPLRRLHRLIFIGLAVLLPLIVALAVIGRPAPVTSPAPAALDAGR